MGAQQVQILDIRQPKECDEERWLNVLSYAVLAFF